MTVFPPNARILQELRRNLRALDAFPEARKKRVFGFKRIAFERCSALLEDPDTRWEPPVSQMVGKKAWQPEL